MSTTPLIKTPQENGGTFYTFSSAARDLTKGFANDNYKIVFSKFVCLNLPDIQPLSPNTNANNASNGGVSGFGDVNFTYTNYMQLNTILGAQNKSLDESTNMNMNDMNKALAEHIQNYILNLEELILSNENYDNSTNETVTERLFFKWLMETGSIRFNHAPESELSRKANRSYIEQNLYFTEATNVPEILDDYENGINDINKYNRVVKYIGDIDIVNNVDLAGEAYTELYINIPTEVGCTPTVLFTSKTDNNYGPRAFGHNGEGRFGRNGENGEYIVGRDSETEHPQGLSIMAFYDDDDNNKYTLGYRGSNKQGLVETDLDENNNEIFKVTYQDNVSDPNEWINENVTVEYCGGTEQGGAYYGVTRSKLDGIGIDFKDDDYSKIVNNPNISTISEFNGTDSSESFEFNAILVYYDVIDKSNNTKNARNLYGLLLLDNVKNNGELCGYIQRYPKFKPNKITGQNGNSYGFKINLRFDVAPGNAGIDTIVNDYNTFSMQLFSDAMGQLQQSTKIFKNQEKQIVDLTKRISYLENILGSINNVQILQNQINKLYQMFENAGIALSSADAITNMIGNLSDEIQDIKDDIAKLKQ